VAREKYIQLPSIAELKETLEKESKRKLAFSKRDLHFVSLDGFRTFLNFLGIDTPNISPDKNWQEVRFVFENVLNQAVPKIMSRPRGLPAKARDLYEYLAEENKPQKSDLIITFGAKTNARAEKAIQLYKRGYSSRLVFSGGSPLYANAEPEAERYKKIALNEGINPKDIITESESITLADNVKSSLNLLDRLGISYQKILVVNSPYAQRRSYSHLQKFTPKGVKVFRVNCATRLGLRKNDWYQNKEGIIYVLSEYYKLWFGLVINTN